MKINDVSNLSISLIEYHDYPEVDQNMFIGEDAELYRKCLMIKRSSIINDESHRKS